MDKTDARILAILQADGRASAGEIGERVGLSVSATHRRIKLLEESGAIDRYAAVLDPRALGYTTDFFVEIALQSQSEATFEAFEDAVARIRRDPRVRYAEPNHRIALLARALHGVSPLATLDRGYAIVLDADGKALTDAARVETGDIVSARLSRGQLVAEVTRVIKK
mgnify:CR=1 FL=1